MERKFSFFRRRGEIIAVVTANILENTSNRLHVPNVWFSAFGTEFNQLYQEIRWFSAYIWYGNFRSKWRSVIRDLKSQIFYEIILNMFLITFNIPVPFTTLLEAFRTFHAKKWFLMAEVLSYPFNGTKTIDFGSFFFLQSPKFPKTPQLQRARSPPSDIHSRKKHTWW